MPIKYQNKIPDYLCYNNIDGDDTIFRSQNTGKEPNRKHITSFRNVNFEHRYSVECFVLPAFWMVLPFKELRILYALVKNIFLFLLYLAIPIKCFVSHRPLSREGGSVGRAKKKKQEC